MAGTRDVSVSESREPTIMIVFIFRFQISDFRHLWSDISSKNPSLVDALVIFRFLTKI